MRLPATVSNGSVTDEQAGWGAKKSRGMAFAVIFGMDTACSASPPLSVGFYRCFGFHRGIALTFPPKESRQRGSTLGVDPFYNCLTLVLVIDSSNIAPPCTSPACVSIVYQSARRRSICFMSGDL